jgi:hypothetical protein
MKKSLPCLSTLLVAIACGDATAQGRAIVPAANRPEAPPPVASSATTTVSPGDRLVVQVVNQFDRHNSVAAHLRHRSSIGGVELHGVGNYWQQGSGETLRVRLELKFANQEGCSLLQVSNRGILWVDRQLPSGRTVTRYNLRQLRVDPVLSAGDLESIQPGEASWSPMQPELSSHSGGLSSLLAALGDHFTFLPPQAMRLALAPPITEQPTNIPVFAVVGHWKPAKLAELTSADQKLESGNSESETSPRLPARLPREVLLLVGQADLFPYRIEYRRQETSLATSGDGNVAPYQLSANPLVVLELSDVAFDLPIDGGQFDYNPKDVEWVDQTAKLRERLRKQRQAEVAGRPSRDSTR